MARRETRYGEITRAMPAVSITISVSTTGLPKEETFSYVEQRITACGGHTGLFTQGTLNLIHQASAGVLRSIGTIAMASFVYTFFGLPID